MNEPLQTIPRHTHQTLPGKKNKPLDLLGFLFRRGLFIALAGSAVGTAFALVLLPIGKPIYKTATVLLVDPAKNPTATGRDRSSIPGDLRDWTRTQLSRIRAKDIMIGAIERVPLEQQPDFIQENPSHPANPFRLMKRINAYENQGTYLITLEMENGDPAGIAELLNAVVDTFLEKLREETEQAYDSRLTYLRAEREKISNRLAEEEQAILDLAEGIENKAFLHEGYNAHLTKVDQIQRLYWEAYDRETQALATLRKVKADRDAILSMSLQAYADERVADNFGINRIEQWTYEQLQQLRASIDGLTVNNEDRKYVESRMDAMNVYLTEYKERVRNETISNLNEKRSYEFDQQVLLATSAAEASSKATQILKEQLDLARQQAGDISMAIFQASSPSLARDQLRERIQALSSRIDDAEMMAKAPIPVQIDQRAETPVAPSSTSHMKLTLAGFVFGFGLVGGLVFLYELVDDRIRSSRDLRLALAGDVPEAIPVFRAEQGETEFGRLLLEHGAHPAAKGLREIASRIAQDKAHHQGQIFVFADTVPHAGATSLSLHVAHALRRMEGPVLLVEWNMETPGLRKVMGIPSGPGLEEFLRGERSWEEVLYRDPERGLDVVSASGSSIPQDVTALGSLLSRQREDYSLVIVDAGVITHELARTACRQADGVLLVNEWKVTRYSDLRNAIERTSRMEVPALTALLNRAPGPEINPLRQILVITTTVISGIADRMFFFRRQKS